MEAKVYASAVAVLLACLLAGCDGGNRLTCYICDTMKDGRDCNDYFVANNPRIAQVSGCGACKKQKTYIGGQQYIKRECDRATRYMLRWECKPATVYSTPGDECYCLTDLCNAATSSHRQMAAIAVAATAIGWLLSATAVRSA